MTKPHVSVCIVTYQHARFIRQAVEGALAQKTDFPVEILIGEDESTDGTREICLDLARRHPDRIRVFLRHRRDVVPIDGRPRGSYNLRMTVGEAQGEFVALCEGDDYWTDPEKLQRQVDYLRANPDCVGCFHNTALVDGEGTVIQPSYFHSTQEKFNQQEVLATLMSSYPTCSLVFRREAFDPLPGWFLRRPCDLYLDIHLTSRGRLGFIDRNMGAYRKHPGGVWGGQRESSQIVELIIRYKLLLADPFFAENYRDLLLRKVDEFQALLFTQADLDGEITRLQGIVREQTGAVTAAKAECDRLTTEDKKSKAEAKRAATEGQQHIDRLKAQLSQHSAEGQKHIDALKVQLDRTVTEDQKVINALKAQLSQHGAEGQKHIDSLKTQLDRTVSENQKTIDALQAQLGRTVSENQRTIDALQTQLERTRADHQKIIDALKAQLDQLAVDARTQSEYISTLEKERDRLTALAGKLTEEGQHYLKVVNEQTAYIKILEGQRR